VSIQNAIIETDFGLATVSIAPTSRSGLVWGEWIDTFSGFPSFATEVWMDLDGTGAAPALVGAADNGPSCFVLGDNGDSGSGLTLSGLAAAWNTRSVECLGPHNGAFQTLRNGVNATTSAATARFQNNTASSFGKIRILSQSGGGRLLGGRIVNLAVLTGAYNDTQADQMRVWTTQYWADTWPAPYSGFVKWSRRMSTNGTTGFGTGDVGLNGSVVFTASGDPPIVVFPSGSGGPSISITAAV
jgi:hypothetical protein